METLTIARVEFWDDYKYRPGEARIFATREQAQEYAEKKQGDEPERNWGFEVKLYEVAAVRMVWP